MNRAALLGGTAIAAVLASYSATAGTVGTGDNLEVSVFGEVRVQLNFVDQDDSAGHGRGYSLKSDEGELGFEARNTADNGFLYGVEVVLNVNTDDTANADKIYAFIDHDNFGRVELGDQDGAIDRMFVAGEDAMVGRGGYDGEVADIFNFGDTWIGVTNSNTGKATKVTYFSPRIAGFQIGASITPDTDSQGASFTERDDNGSFENVFEIAANFAGEFEGFEIVVSGFGEFGDGEVDTSSSGNSVGGTSAGDAETYGFGATISYAGFTLGAGWADLQEAGISQSDQALGVDAGEWFSVGLSYRSGPWGVAVGYYEAKLSNGTGVPDTKNQVITIGAEYEVAPGWLLYGEVDLNDAENRNRVAGNDNDGNVAIIYNIFTF